MQKVRLLSLNFDDFSAIFNWIHFDAKSEVIVFELQ